MKPSPQRWNSISMRTETSSTLASLRRARRSPIRCGRSKSSSTLEQGIFFPFSGRTGLPTSSTTGQPGLDLPIHEDNVDKFDWCVVGLIAGVVLGFLFAYMKGVLL